MKVKFVPQDIVADIKPGQSVMHVAQDHGLYIKSVCKGVPSCAECRVRIVEGEHNVLHPGAEELALIGTGHFIDRRRLSCQLKCFGDVTIDLSEQIEKQHSLTSIHKLKKVKAKDDRVEELVAIRQNTEDATDEGEGVELEVPRSAEPRNDQPRSEKAGNDQAKTGLSPERNRDDSSNASPSPLGPRPRRRRRRNANRGGPKN